MTVIEKILEWSPQLPPWQSDALRRLFARRQLTSADYEDLVALALSSHQIPDEKGRVPEILEQRHVPASPSSGVPVRLTSMGPLRNVNALATEQVLSFGVSGLTIIYGDNGAGKSGYARVLKRACRARDEEAVLPNAELSEAEQGTPEASFAITVDGKEELPIWIDGASPPEALSALSVFDGLCARVYLDDESDIAFKPYGLDLIEDLGQVCDEVKRRIRETTDGIQIDFSAFDDLKGATAVGQLISTLSADTDTSQIESLTTLSAEDRKRIGQLDSLLREANPVEKAKTLRNKASRILRLADSVDRVFADLSDEVWARHRANDQAFLDAKKASELVQAGIQADVDALPGTGGDLWKTLWIAAEAYSGQAYPDHPFPHVGLGAKCVLCQQPLAEGRDRYQRFGELLQSVAEAELNKAIARRTKSETTLRDIATDLPLDPELQSDIEGEDPILAASCIALVSGISKRKQSLLLAFTSHDDGGIEAIPASPAAELRTLATRIASDAEVLEKSNDAQVIAALKQERLELSSREALSARKPALLKILAEAKAKSLLLTCVAGIDTSAISRKSKSLTQETISTSLANALNGEFAALGIEHLRVAIDTHARYGQTFQKLRLDLPSGGDIDNILSEGEQRALAIASFLAEISIDATHSGLIFDDPVSSLDHIRRDKVAVRLVHEGHHRQVIIFTHDLYFLKQLTQEATKQKVPIHYQTVFRRNAEIGVISSDLPFEGKSTSQRVGELKQLAQSALAAARNGRSTEATALIAGGYDLLRRAWERAVEEVLLQGVVERFDKGVHTEKLRGVHVEDQDYEDIFNGMTRCSEFTGHDRASAAGVTVLDPQSFESDVLALDAFRARVAGRVKAVSEPRKQKPKAAPAVAPVASS